MNHKFIQILFYFFSLILGCIMMSWMIYSPFIRERLPKDIPMFLTEYRFWILLYICGMYLYIIISLLTSKKSNEFFLKLVEFIYTPLISLDHFIKYSKLSKPFYYIFINKMIQNLQYLTCNIIIYVIIMFQIFPRMILIFFLYKDVFFMHKIEIFYKFILIGLIPFIFKYMIYCVKDIKKHYIEELEQKYSHILMQDKSYADPFVDWELTEDNKLHNQRLSIKDYVQFKTENKVYNITNTVYEETLVAKEITYQQYYKENNILDNVDLSNEDYQNIEKLYNDIIPLILEASVFIEIHSFAKEKKFLILLKLIIYLLYFFCWAYVLLISYYKYPINFPYTVLHLYLTIYYLEEPFSGIPFGYNIS